MILPNNVFTLDSRIGYDERKRVFHILKNAGVPIFSKSEKDGELVDIEYPLSLGWSIKLGTLSHCMWPEPNHYSPDEFLKQFGLQ